MGRVVRVLLVLLLAGSTGLGAYSTRRSAPPPPGPFPDVPSSHFAAAQIRKVAVDADWLRTFGRDRFAPAEPLTRIQLAVAVVKAFAPSAKQHPKITFSDLPSKDARFHHANVAASLGWMGTSAGRFLPDKALSKADLATVLTRALGLRKELAGLDAIATVDGTAVTHPRTFAPLVLAGALRMFHNHADDALDLLPTSIVPRGDGAFALWAAASAKGTWRIRALERFRAIAIGSASPERLAAISHAFGLAGFPYVPAGEWATPTPPRYCCGAQKQGGFDCSGFVWWVLRAPGNGFDNAKARGFAGWPLPERTSREMAKAAPVRIAPADAQAGDLLFSDIDGKGSDWQAIDHVGIALGNGWMIHSSTPGVLIEWIGDGWWTTRLRWARRLGAQPPPAPRPSASPSPRPTGSPSPAGSPRPSASPA